MASNAAKILLEFGTRNLDKAKQLAKEVKTDLLAAARSIKDVDARKAARKKIAADYKSAREAIKEEGIRRGLAPRARRLVGQDAGIAAKFQREGAAALEGVGIAKGLAGGSPLSGIAALSSKFSGPAALIFQASQAVVEVVRPFVEREIQRERERFLAPRLAELEKQLEELKFSRRLKDDPAYARRIARHASDEAAAILKAQRVYGPQRWARRAGGIEGL